MNNDLTLTFYEEVNKIMRDKKERKRKFNKD